MESSFSKNICTGAHIGGQVLTSEGQTCSLGTAFTNNATKTDPDEAVGAVRAGKALLAGLLRCGHCGRKMHVGYWGKSGTSPRYRCRGTCDAGGTSCVMFGGAGVDRRFTQELLHVISPLG